MGEFFRYLFHLYQKLLKWMESRASKSLLCLTAFSEASFFLVPPEVLLIPLCVARPRRSFFYAFLTTLFSVLGAVSGYLLGFYFMDTLGVKIIDFFSLHSQFIYTQSLYQRYGEIIVFISAFTPIPYKVFTITSGALKINLWTFIVFSLAGRGGRYFLLALLFYLWGEGARDFIDRHFNTLVIITVVIVVLTFIIWLVW